MIKGGYILQPRKIDESIISNSPPHVREIWLYLLRKANHKEKKISGKTIKRGQLFTSYSEIREALKWRIGYRTEKYTKTNCEVAMRVLTKEHMVNTAKSTRGMLITICNYDYYQNPNNYEVDNEIDNKSTTDRQQVDTINKNDKNDKNKNNILSQVEKSTCDPILLPYFEIALSFWNLFKKNMEALNLKTTILNNAKFNEWVNPIRLLIEQDGKTKEEIREVYKFIRDDDFWGGQIRSTAKLRKKDKNGEKYFDKMLYQSRHEKNRKNNKSVIGKNEETARLLAEEIRATQP
jgi:uncharacterized protein (UPF0335 family)